MIKKYIDLQTHDTNMFTSYKLAIPSSRCHIRCSQIASFCDSAVSHVPKLPALPSFVGVHTHCNSNPIAIILFSNEKAHVSISLRFRCVSFLAVDRCWTMIVVVGYSMFGCSPPPPKNRDKSTINDVAMIWGCDPTN